MSKMMDYNKKKWEEDFSLRLNDADVVFAVLAKQVDTGSLIALKEESGVSGEMLSVWLHVTPKTLRSYLSRKSVLAENLGEQVLLLRALFKHGASVFGSVKVFESWLEKENRMLDWMKPKSYLGTITGIRFIDDSLYGMEYGDNA
jgi:hypothetical protein